MTKPPILDPFPANFKKMKAHYDKHAAKAAKKAGKKKKPKAKPKSEFSSWVLA